MTAITRSRKLLYLGFASLIFFSGSLSLAQREFNIITELNRALKNNLVNDVVAQKYAKAVFESQFGREGIDVPLPLTVKDMGEEWDVSGRISLPVHEKDPYPLVAILRIRIMKLDGRIVDLVRLVLPASEQKDTS